MMLLLAADTVDLYAPSTTVDTYGWAEPDVVVIAWTGLGNLQLTGGVSDPRATDAGGAGPFDPRYTPIGQLFLPTDAPVEEGCTADIGGKTYVLSQTRLVPDPTGFGIDCWNATVTEVTTWPV